MKTSDVLLAVAAVGLALAASRGDLGTPATAMPASSVISQQVGQRVTLTSVRVEAVPADEGFWVNSDHGRVWVQIMTARESPYTVHAGDVVNLTGEVVANGPDFPAQVGLSGAEGAADLAAQRAHIAIAVDALAFVRT